MQWSPCGINLIYIPFSEMKIRQSKHPPHKSKAICHFQCHWFRRIFPTGQFSRVTQNLNNNSMLRSVPVIRFSYNPKTDAISKIYIKFQRTTPLTCYHKQINSHRTQNSLKIIRLSYTYFTRISRKVSDISDLLYHTST